MCTAATYKTNDFYFGRTLDYEFSYGDQITITPRNYKFDFRFKKSDSTDDETYSSSTLGNIPYSREYRSKKVAKYIARYPINKASAKNFKK